MRINRIPGSRGLRAVGTGVAVLALGALVAGTAGADAFVPLPDGEKVGPGAKVTRTGEHAVVSPSLAANGAGRVAWVSANVTADVTATPEGEVGPYNGPNNNPGTNNSSTHGTSQLNTGYIVGCQVAIGDDAISAGVSGGISTGGLSAGGSVGLELGPGEVKFVQIDKKDITKPGVYAIEYQDVEIQVQGCAGYAQARSYSVVEIIGDHYSKTTLYGAPFSIG
ncbi:MspA family porin [Nocardia caishijiensis]|uniref:MspA protein n=1 Tax=Nocardia caishijiensis TaxID=184756 RepID=A0ABQ6YK81_9NOCA|nr:MspA family porin [Nocardia caishijiensis]KAF0846048.1 MspA protein [Nocardia caishijiensis]